MVNSASSFSLLLEQRLAALGTNAFAAEQAAGLPADAIRNVIRSVKKEGPSISRAKEICDAVGLEFYIGPKRELSGFSDPGQGTDLGRTEALRSGFLPIPWHATAKRRGSAPVALQSSWLASEGIIPDHLQAIMPDRVQISAADPKKTVAVLDTSADLKGSHSLWCYSLSGEVTVGRAAFTDNVIVVFPDPDKDGPIRIIDRHAQQGFAILGRVIWLGMTPKIAG